ncbi:DUF1254 domain-containing protein [Croceicoccus sp. Ery15]|uniref:DUF1254 domain-containing protein n=1 Tax=Croceicoccus sp. Ery15 TaxID=1703338 RepID=UPI001E435B68|nr:DUF1254 domain-containing protein [Croceicoccus sp. Ery15]
MRATMIAVAALCLAGCGQADQAETSIAASPSELTAEQARQYAHDSYVFTYPLALYYRTMYNQAIKPGMAFGQWLHLGTSTPDDTDIVTPNNDTPYSYAWVDVRAEPWVLTMPAIDKDRYYTSQWDDSWGYVIDNPGSVLDGNGGGNYLLAGPDWNGELPDGINRVIRGESTLLGTITRTQLLGGPQDMPAVRKIQQQYKLQPLSAFLGTEPPAPAPAVEWPEWTEGDEKTEKYWDYVAFMLPFIAPNPDDADAMAKLSALGVEAGKDWNPETLDPAIRDAVAQGVQDAIAEFDEWGTNPKLDSGKIFGSRATQGTDYLNRALGTYLGIFGNVSQQAMYLQIPIDASGEPLDGSKHNYTITFPKGETPPVDYFWSFTMYKVPQRWLVANPIDRYSISNRTKGIKTNADGSLTLYFQHESPGKDKESNWLPAPDGPFWMVLRNYGPDETIIDGTFPAPRPVPTGE